MALTLTRTKKNPSLIFQGITKALLGAVVFLLPLFFLPGIGDPVELPKGVLLIVLTFAAAVCWALSWVVAGEMRWRKVPGFWLLMGILVAVVLSTVFSVNRTVSIIGATGYIHHTLPVILSLIVFVILMTQVLDRERDIEPFVGALVASFGLAAVSSLLQVAGVSPFGLAELKASTFIVTGNSIASLAVVMAMILPLGIMLLRVIKARVWIFLTYGTLILAALLLLAIDSTAGWIAALVGVIVTVAFISTKKYSKLELGLFTAAMVIAIVGLLVPTSGIIKTSVSQDLRLDTSNAWSVTQSVVKAMPVIGSGPSTFFYDFVHYRPAGFSATSIGTYRFVKASDDALQQLSMFGILGAVLMLAFIGYLLYSIANAGEVSNRAKRGDWPVIAALVGAWSGLAAALFFTPSTMTTYGLFWILAGFCLLVIQNGAKESVSKRPFAKSGAVVSFIALLGALVVSAVWGTRLILANRELVRINGAVSKVEDLGTVSGMIDRAIRLNPHSPTAYVLRAQSDLVQAQLLAQGQTNPSGVKALLAQTIADAEHAISLDPNNPAVLETVAALYKNYSNVTGSGDDMVLGAYEREAKIEPNNAMVQLNMGEAYYLVASTLSGQQKPDAATIATDVAKARTALSATLKLLPGNVDAQYGLILLDELSGNKDQAFTALQQLVKDNQNSGALWYALGMRYLDRKDTANAKTSFTNAITMQPSLTDAHWQLALIADAAKDYATAKTQYQIVKQLDPTNTDVQAKLDALPKQ